MKLKIRGEVGSRKMERLIRKEDNRFFGRKVMRYFEREYEIFSFYREKRKYSY